MDKISFITHKYLKTKKTGINPALSNTVYSLKILIVVFNICIFCSGKLPRNNLVSNL